MSLYLFIIIPIAAATLIYLIPHKSVKHFSIIIQGILLVASVYNFLIVKQNGVVVERLGGWEGYIGITLKSDRLSGVFVMMTAFLFFLFLLYGLLDEYYTNVFVFLFLVLQSLIMTLFLTNDLFNTYIIIELSTIVVSILIVFNRDSRSVYDGLVYLLSNIVAMVFFLFGVAYLYKLTGILDISGIKNILTKIDNPRKLYLPFAFLMTGIGLKCAVMPLFSWLPKAHGTASAPAIVSAVLSGLYVKTGIYLFIRIREMFLPVINLDKFFLFVGIITGIIGFILALGQRDLKLILAYHTISQLGLILTGISSGSKYAFWGSVYHIFNHAMFKSVLFLSAGIIIKEYGTRNIYKIKGFFQREPIVATGMLLAILGITGAPLFNGSVSKYLIISGVKGSIVEYFIILINLGTIISFIKFSRVLLREKKNNTRNFSDETYSGSDIKSCGVLKKISVLILGVMCLSGGVFGSSIIKYLFGYQMIMTMDAVLEKAIIYIISFIVGYVLYRFILSKLRFFHKGYGIELSINGINATTLTYFVLLMIALFVYGV